MAQVKNVVYYLVKCLIFIFRHYTLFTSFLKPSGLLVNGCAPVPSSSALLPLRPSVQIRTGREFKSLLIRFTSKHCCGNAKYLVTFIHPTMIW